MSPPSLAVRARTAAARLAGVARATAAVAGRGGHPIVDGRIGVAGLERPVEVLRDAFGVPHVFADGEADACFGHGFVHAQDRLFQMDAMRRLALGRLAEIGGVRLLSSDRFMRRLGLADRAGRDYAQIAERDRVLLEAYARGVNAGVRSLPTLPPEYAVTGVPPEPWDPEHSLLLGRLMLFTFAFNWDTELLRERLLQALGAERAWEVDPAYPAHGVTATGAPHAAAGARLLASLRAAREAGLPVGGASNAWALSGCAHGERRAVAGERPPPAVATARPVPRRPPRGRGLRRDRRRHRRPPRRDDRPQRTRRVGPDRRDGRRQRLLRRNRSPRRPDAIPHAGGVGDRPHAHRAHPRAERRQRRGTRAGDASTGR